MIDIIYTVTAFTSLRQICPKYIIYKQRTFTYTRTVPSAGFTFQLIYFSTNSRARHPIFFVCSILYVCEFIYKLLHSIHTYIYVHIGTYIYANVFVRIIIYIRFGARHIHTEMVVTRQDEGMAMRKGKKRKVFATKNALCLVALKSPRARTESRIFIWTSHRRRRT